MESPCHVPVVSAQDPVPDLVLNGMGRSAGVTSVTRTYGDGRMASPAKGCDSPTVALTRFDARAPALDHDETVDPNNVTIAEHGPIHA